MPKAPQLPAMHIAIENNQHQKIADLMTDTKQIDALNNYSDTPLVVAAKKGKLSIARMLIDNGANVNFKNPVTGNTPLFAGIKSKNYEIVNLLMANGARFDQQNNTGQTPQLYACKQGDIELIRILGRHGARFASSKETPYIVVAAINGNKDVMTFLIGHSANVNLKDKNGRTALMVASLYGHADIVTLLLENGAIVDERDEYGATAVYYAARMGQIDCVKQLTASGAGVNISTQSNETPLFQCAFKTEIAEHLFSKGGQIERVKVDEPYFQSAALSYEWFGEFFSRKSSLADHVTDKEDLQYQARFAYKMAGIYFNKAAVQLEKTANGFRSQQYVTAFRNALYALSSPITAAIYPPKAHEIGTTSYLMEKTNGAGTITYNTSKMDPEGLDDLEAQYRKKARELKQRAVACNNAALN